MAKNPQQLSDRHRRFCEEYVKHFNATKSYKAAYPDVSDRTAGQNGFELLKKTEIQAYIEKLKEKALIENNVTPQSVIREVARIAFANVTDVLTFNDNGVVLKDSTKLNPDIKAAISEVTYTEGRSGIKKSVKMHNKVAALEKLMTYLGLTSDLNVAIGTFSKYGYQVIEEGENYRIVKENADTSETTAEDSD